MNGGRTDDPRTMVEVVFPLLAEEGEATGDPLETPAKMHDVVEVIGVVSRVLENEVGSHSCWKLLNLSYSREQLLLEKVEQITQLKGGIQRKSSKAKL